MRNKNLKKKKLAFVHIPKSAGVSAEVWFYRMLGHKSDIVWANSWRMGMGRDWLPSEIHSCLHFPKVFIHNHSPNWTIESLEELKEHGFFVFAWIRKCPYDCLCSYYHFFRNMQEHYDREDIGAEFFKPTRGAVFEAPEMDVNEWLVKWADLFSGILPMKTYKYFDYFKVYSDKNFGDFIEQELELKYYDHRPPIMHMNKSENRGWRYYRKSGIITDETVDFLKNGKYVNLYNELLAKANE